MDIKEQIIQEYLASGCGYRKLQSKYGISRTTICKWVQVYQGIHNLAPTDLQQKHYKNPMERKQKDKQPGGGEREAELLQKIAHQELKAEVLDTLINVAEKQLNITIRKKPGTQQSSK